jgi:hypothetical protein
VRGVTLLRMRYEDCPIYALHVREDERHSSFYLQSGQLSSLRTAYSIRALLQ